MLLLPPSGSGPSLVYAGYILYRLLPLAVHVLTSDLDIPGTLSGGSKLKGLEVLLVDFPPEDLEKYTFNLKILKLGMPLEFDRPVPANLGSSSTSLLLGVSVCEA